ncbi:ATP-binding cassette domain-containing protein [Nitratireductor sp. XY-223]|uniref:ABC transporter ATP-binding protein n=1 Tax=Nitratireductor sp. XY-223 TaxID=2561926 RepID=UPI0010AAC9B4|nr:ATP-binding cassette domain-containing protein [Nitratireductor sp. XY-223]
MAETVLETENLTMRFGGVVAADNVSFRLAARELRCLIGPNGAGKSTFFKCITGLLTPSDGRIFMRHEETTGWHPHEIASLGVGVKTQVPSVMDGLTVRENIWLAARRRHPVVEANRKTADMIERLELNAIAAADVGRLAHGERQQVELGIVAVGDPWLVLLDEPAAGMSAGDVERMVAIIRELNRSAAVIIVEHDMQFIRSIASTVTVFHQGSVLMEDHVDKVMSDETVRRVYLGKKG